MSKAFLKRVNSLYSLPYLFLAFFVIGFIRGFSIQDAVVAFPLCALYGYHLYLKSKRFNGLEAHVRNEMLQMKAHLSTIKMASTKSSSVASDLKPGQRLF